MQLLATSTVTYNAIKSDLQIIFIRVKIFLYDNA